jgi:hypothetical protein
MPVSPVKHVLVILLVGWSTFVSGQRHEHYYIVFSARDVSLRPFSIGGHAFVSWGFANGSPLICSEKSLGFFPGNDMNMLDALVATKRGRVVKGYFNNSKGLYMRQLTVEVDSTVWANTQCEADIWNYQPYNLLTRNCLHFMDNVAKMADLRRPRTSTFFFRLPKRPVKYTRQLFRKNKKRAIFFQEMQFDLR